jgi:choline dehydrogenase-like flavoprotein
VGVFFVQYCVFVFVLIFRYVHFGIPDTSPLYSATGSAKILVQHRHPTPTEHGWNAVLEIGSDWNQARYVDPDIIDEHLRLRGENSQLCELVFLTASPLGDENYVLPSLNGQHVDGRPMRVHCKVQRRAEVMLPEMEELKQRILSFADAYPLPGDAVDLPLNLAPIGGVAHEVGTMRLSDDPDKGVVDTNLKMHNYENLYCCDLSVFPTSPAANPSLTLAALALRLADHLAPKQ